MKWLDLLPKIKPTRTSPLVYLIALGVVIFLLVFWFSLRPSANARDFLPANTAFYQEWTDQQYWTKVNNWPFNHFNLPDTANNLAFLQDVLGDNYGQLQQLVWFQLEASPDYHYLLRFHKPLRKKTVNEINGRQPEQQLYQVQADIYLLTVNQGLREQLPEQITDKFLLADGNQGINLYFNLDQAPENLRLFGELLKNKFFNGSVFVNFDFDRGQINAYQKKNESLVANSWSGWQLPNDFGAVLTLNGTTTNDLITKNLLPVLLPDFPSYYFTQFTDRLHNSLLVINEDSWLLANNQDWQPFIGDYTATFGVEERVKSLPDKTKYTELIRKADFVPEQKEFVGYQYWRVADFYGMELAGYFYLSNSEKYLQEAIVGRRYTQDLWSSCVLEGEQVDSFMFMDKNILEKLGLKTFFKDKISRLGFYSYQTNQILGLKLCY